MGLPNMGGEKMKILIIEDNKKIRDELKVFLEKYGYEIICLERFENAAEQALAFHPHLVLLDINLPVYDGFLVCREIRKESAVPIVVTSRDSDVDELMSMNFGADDFITKPYNTQILLAHIAAILNRTYQAQSEMSHEYAGLLVNMSKGTASYQGKEAALTKNELRILDLLMRNQTSITQRDDIMEALWQSNEFIDDNTLTVNINRLRKKLEAIGASDYIKTKRGQGYSL